MISKLGYPVWFDFIFLFRIVGRGGGFLYYLKYGFRLKHKTKNGLSRII